MRDLKFMAICIATTILTACSGGGSSGSSGGGTPSPTPAIASTGVNIGNVSTIPLGLGGGTTSATITNNYSTPLTLKNATYVQYGPSGTGKAQDATTSVSPVNTALCSNIQANGTCSLVLSTPADTSQDGQYMLTMNYINPSDPQKIIPISTLVSYSGSVPTSPTGVQYSIINNTVYNSANASTSYSVPFILTIGANSLSATSQNNNPAFAPTISCAGTAPYPAGTACTLLVVISGTGTADTISGNITVTANASAAQLKSDKWDIKGSTGYLFNVPITVVQNNTGNLVTSATNVTVNPANGTSPQTITLLNNGAGSITGISIQGNTPTIVSANTCPATLITGASCTFAVNATLTQNAQSSVVVNYTSNGTNNSIAFNVIYIVPSSTAGLSMTTSGNLNNTVINTTNTINISVTNTGSATLNNIAFTPLTIAGMSYGSGGSCATNGSQSLPAGASCTLVIQYAPTATSTGPSFTIRETANYVAPDGSTGSYTGAAVVVNYTAITGNAFVYITPNYVSYAIRADNTDTATQTFTLVNAGPISTTVSAESLANPPVTAYTSTGGTCVFPQTLNSNQSCTVIARFGPTASTISTTSQMTATYTTSGSTTATAFSNLAFTSSPAALVSIASLAVTGQTGGNGQTNLTPYTFINSPAAAQIQFTLTYQNTGTQSANTFSVALNTLPIGYYSAGGTCNSGAGGTSTLNASSTCTVIFKAESTALYNSYSLNSPIPFQLPGFSYVDTNTGLNTNTAPTLAPYGATVYVTPTALATVTESAATWTTAATGGTNTLTFLGGSGTPANTQVTILNQTNFTAGGTFTFNSGSGSGGVGACIITTINGNCTIGVINAAGLPLTTVYFFYLVSPVATPTLGITASGSISFTS